MGPDQRLPLAAQSCMGANQKLRTGYSDGELVRFEIIMRGMRRPELS